MDRGGGQRASPHCGPGPVPDRKSLVATSAGWLLYLRPAGAANSRDVDQGVMDCPACAIRPQGGSTVLITGESGSGKERVARLVRPLAGASPGEQPRQP
jgi:hypothetical protein